MTGKEYKDATISGVNLCGRARRSGLSSSIQMGDEAELHPTAVELMKFLETLDTLEYDSHFAWMWNREKDGDGAILLSQLNTYFQQKDRDKDEIRTN